MNKRRIISWILLICLLFSTKVTYAEVDRASLDSVASALNKVGLISGDGKGNYNLERSLKRSDATAFIVNLMGKKNYLEENKEKYIDTGFSDVKKSDWFAAQVGFCKENMILSGIGNNKFGPNNNVTEKAFLTMVMKVLGYTSEDFDWNQVYGKAYEIGLVSGDEYIGKTTDNMNYTRGNVVQVMYTALGLKLNNSDNTVIKKLLIEGQITPQ